MQQSSTSFSITYKKHQNICARTFTEALFEGNWKGPKCPGSINYGTSIQWTVLQL